MTGAGALTSVSLGPELENGASWRDRPNGSSIRHVAVVLQGLGAGGSEHIVSQLCNHLASRGWRVTVFAFEDPGTTPYYHHDPAVRIVPLGLRPERRQPIAATTAVLARGRRLLHALRAAAPDLIVSFLTRPNILSIAAGRRLGVPVIVSERNNPALQKIGPVWGALRRFGYPQAAGLVTMTHGAMRHFSGQTPPRTWVIPNPATLPRTRNYVRSGGRTIGAVGRLVPQKGFDLLLEAFARAARAAPDWRLVIWGEGPERAALEAQRTRLGLTGKVDLPGVTAQPGDWLAQSDMFVLSSRYEGWGLVVGEAMAAGLPVVSFDCEWGPAEMIEDGVSGLLVPSGDVTALGDALSGLCGDAERRAMLGQRAAIRMLDFDQERVMQKWEAAMIEVLDGAGA